MYRMLPLLAVVVLVVGGVLLYLLAAPSLERRRARQKRRDERRDAIEAKQAEWDLENMDAAREELRRHKARMERSLDDLHDPK